MHGRRSETIGLIVPTIDHAIFGELVQAFSEELDRQGFTILMTSHGFDLSREYKMMRKLLEHRVDGVAIIGLDHAEATYQLIEQQGVPAISMWNYDPASRIPCVGADNFEAGYIAALNLVKNGHRKIATIFPDAHQNDRARRRWAGAQAGLLEAGITIPVQWRSQSPYSIAEAKKASFDILAQNDKPTAILCGNDVIAQGTMFAAQSLGLQLPDALSVMGIGDFKGSAEIEPPLTTIRIPAQKIGMLAAQLLVSKISEAGGQGEAIWRDRSCCDLRFIERASVIAVKTSDSCMGT